MSRITICEICFEIGKYSLIGFVFVALKLCGVIHWPWWWVTAPFWGYLVVLAVSFVIALYLFGLFGICAWICSIKKPPKKTTKEAQQEMESNQ